MKLTVSGRIWLSILAAFSLALASCGPNFQDDPNAYWPHTGWEISESQMATNPAANLERGLRLFVSADRVRIRTSPEISENIAGHLDVNDTVEVVDPALIGSSNFIAIRVVKSASGVSADVVVYISADYLNATPVAVERGSGANGLMIVTNIATEKARVYRKCEPEEGCVNKLIFEQDVVNGEDDDGTRTILGNFKIASWHKFYETGPYPAWYRPHYPAPPKPNAGMTDWVSDRFMPGGRGDMRGAFGWYTMKVGPNPAAQWMHGTAGWGADKKKFIVFKETLRGKLLNLFTSIRSHGCTRIDNESIAYLRSLLPVGTTYVKIYAREALRNPEPVGYSKDPVKWSYIMTKKDYGKTNNHQLAERDIVLASNTPRSEWLEEGTFSVDQYPNAVPASGRADLYKLGKRAFRGVFLVDEGTVVDYQHPNELGEGGFRDGLPSMMKTSDRTYSLPEKERTPRQKGYEERGRRLGPRG